MSHVGRGTGGGGRRADAPTTLLCRARGTSAAARASFISCCSQSNTASTFIRASFHTRLVALFCLSCAVGGLQRALVHDGLLVIELRLLRVELLDQRSALLSSCSPLVLCFCVYSFSSSVRERCRRRAKRTNSAAWQREPARFEPARMHTYALSALAGSTTATCPARSPSYMTCATAPSTSAFWDKHSATCVCTRPLGFQQHFEGGTQLLAIGIHEQTNRLWRREQARDARASVRSACASHVCCMQLACS
eukprot:4354101-Pleurochrysis_carterae.AAC.1